MRRLYSGVAYTFEEATDFHKRRPDIQKRAHSRLGVEEVFEPVIGIEVHAQLKTGIKVGFAPAPQGLTLLLIQIHVLSAWDFPARLPVLNKKALLYGIKTGLALNLRNRGGFRI